MTKKLEETEAASSIAMMKLSKKRKIIQEQAKLIKVKEKESSAEGRNAKDKQVRYASKPHGRKDLEQGMYQQGNNRVRRGGVR